MKFEIRNCKLDDVKSLKLLWADVFNDEEKYINKFFDSVFSTQNTFVALDQNMPVGMMFMLDATLKLGENTFNAGYIYAVATDKNYRGQGIMSALEDYANTVARDRKISVLALVPANKSLFKMYEKLGYKTVFYKKNTVITSVENKKSQLLDCTKENFLELRKNMLKEEISYFEFNDICKNYRYDTLKEYLEVLLYTDDSVCGYIVGLKTGHHYKILETSLPLSELGKVAYAISEKYYKLRNISVNGKNGTLIPYGMLKSLDNRVNIYDVVKFNPYMNLMLE